MKAIPFLLLTLGWMTHTSAAESGSTPQQPPTRKPSLADTIRTQVYADNTFRLYINGELVAVDSITFLPHNVVSVDILPAYPMTLAVIAMDNADPVTGMEYANTQIGDGGFILKMGDGTVTDGTWKALTVSHGPVGGDTQNPKLVSQPIPAKWNHVDFDDSDWPAATVHSHEEVGPKETFQDFDFQGAQFIWGPNLKLDNMVLLRKVVPAPPDGKPRPDFRGLTDTVPQSPRRGGRPGGPGKPSRKNNPAN